MADKIVTIVFRGLMVFNPQGNMMEIGFLNALPTPHDPAHGGADPHDHPPHIPRILTMKGNILTSVFDLRNRPELGKVRNWELRAVNPSPAQTTATPFTVPGNLIRTTAPTPANARDFRWITDLEGSDMHGRDLSPELDTRKLLLVLYVRRGEFSTKFHSPRLKRKRMNTAQEVPYGFSAAVTACEIKLLDTPLSAVRLMAGGGAGTLAFEFKPDPDTIYEISNSPPDVPTDAPTPLGADGHFHVYYDALFNQSPNDKFDLIRDDAAPAPDPALCGAALLGQREDPL